MKETELSILDLSRIFVALMLHSQTIRHKKGRHRAQVLMIKYTNTISYRARFNDSCRYDTGHDQKDWLKMFGLKQNYFRPHRNSDMGAWRYNPGTDRIELAEYGHDSTGDVTLSPIGDIQIGEWSQVIQINRQGWLSLPWFGGTSRAPHDVSYEVQWV